MKNVIYLMLRRMRLPLIMLITVYAIAVLGLTLIPGQDDQGQPWRMDFFHAIYFVSFLGSTIGLGEIPYPFTDAQRMWTTFIIYSSVIAWLYAIGAILTLVQDQGFRRVLAYSAFSRKVRRVQEAFYIICGYGDASSLLVRELVDRGMHCVVIEKDQNKILGLAVEDLPDYVPGLCEDATLSENLLAAGLKHTKCRGVIALTGDDHCNLTIAISSKLLAPELPVICQSDSQDFAANMSSFGTDHIVDPFEIFASRFAMMFHSPSMYLVYEWMTTVMHSPLADLTKLPTGTWLLCGYGRFGRAINQHITQEGVETRIIEADPDATDAPVSAIIGRGTEAHTLEAAGIQNVQGLIAGTDNDANNLSIIVTARHLNPDLFTAARQNQQNKSDIFKAAPIDLIMQPSTIVAKHILGIILAPLLDDFLRLTHDKNEEWANVLVSRVAGVVEDVAPDVWDMEISPLTTPALFDCLIRGETLTLEQLSTHPRDPEQQLSCVPLLIKRGEDYLLLPEMKEPLQACDRILFCGLSNAHREITQLSYDHQALRYVRTGIDKPSGYFWRWVTRDQIGIH
ncbi:Potassium channel protein [hydrothermal vent metagenome]|uniref:Potassium channel protein n=1 Tax=hydrothermal vent metagenome TaxID=652676 RepID=A0A3B0Z3Q5_9ZZZZ